MKLRLYFVFIYIVHCEIAYSQNVSILKCHYFYLFDWEKDTTLTEGLISVYISKERDTLFSRQEILIERLVEKYSQKEYKKILSNQIETSYYKGSFYTEELGYGTSNRNFFKDYISYNYHDPFNNIFTFQRILYVNIWKKKNYIFILTYRTYLPKKESLNQGILHFLNKKEIIKIIFNDC